MVMSYKDFDYVGWVPCVSGRLLFEYSDCGLKRSDKDIHARTSNIELNKTTNIEHRYIVVSSAVNWQDGNTDFDGNFHVVLLSSSPVEAEQIEGRVYIISSSNDEWKQLEIEADLSDIERLSILGEDIKNCFQDLQCKLDNFKINKYFKTNFVLLSSGFTFLKHDISKSEASDQLAETSKIIARQSYYYVKYSFHKHSHHDKSAESLTTIHSIPAKNEDIGKILSDGLKQSLVKLKRDSEASDYKKFLQAKGIVSYAKSLLVSCEKEGFIHPDDYRTERLYIENLGESLESSGRRIEAQLAAKERISSNYRSLILFIVSVLAPIIIVYQQAIRETIGANQPTAIINLVSFLSQHIFILVVALVIGYWKYSKMILNFGSHDFAFDKFRKLIEFVVDNKRSANIIIGVLIIFAMLAIYSALSLVI